MTTENKSVRKTSTKQKSERHDPIMIKLTIRTASNQETRLFDKSIVVIGSHTPEADICLSETTLQPSHLKIIEQNNTFVLINIANDPFATINGNSFGKKTLSSGDQIEVGDATIVFDMTNKLNDAVESLDSENMLNRLESKITSSTTFSNSEIPIEQQEEIHQQSLDELEQWELEYLAQEAEEELEREASAAKGMPIKTVLSIKDAHLSETGEENETWSSKKEKEKKEPLDSKPNFKKWVIILLLLFLTLFGAGGTLLYFYIRHTAILEETHAAQGVADIAMALTYAQIHDLKPHNQSWSDHDFLKDNLAAVVSDPHRLASYLDPQSYFHKNFYSLRIYTSSDLSNFLLIAQPMSSFWHLLIPQSSILVDSRSMELRKSQDLHSLNRLLIDTDSLEKDHMDEIVLLMKHEDLVPLATLSGDLDTKDFTVPSTLAQLDPGSENLIYNAPRYYRLGKPLLETTMKLGNGDGNIADATFLNNETKTLLQLDKLILYTPEDRQTADHIKQTLLAYVPEASTIQFGWLTFDQKGDISCCHLLHEDSDQEVAEALMPPKRSKELEKTDPLDDIVLNLQKERRQTLVPYATYLIELLKMELAQPSGKFDAQYEELSKLFLELCKKENQKFQQYSLPDEYQDKQDATYETLLKNIRQLIDSNSKNQ